VQALKIFALYFQTTFKVTTTVLVVVV